MLESWVGLAAEEPLFLALRAFELGRTEIELDLAERDHWEEVDRLQSRKVGRARGWVQPWHSDAAPTIQGWIEDNPSGRIVDIINKLDEWLDEYGSKRRGFHRPNINSLRKTLENMNRRGLIVWSKLPSREGGDENPLIGI